VDVISDGHEFRHDVCARCGHDHCEGRGSCDKSRTLRIKLC
jgi:hypothetical protein